MLHPNQKLTAARTSWTDELKQELKAARESQPHASWASIVEGNSTLKPFGYVSFNGCTVH